MALEEQSDRRKEPAPSALWVDISGDENQLSAELWASPVQPLFQNESTESGPSPAALSATLLKVH